MSVKAIKWSFTVIIYIISIVCNIQEEFSPQQRNIITFQISVYNIFVNVSFCYKY